MSGVRICLVILISLVMALSAAIVSPNHNPSIDEPPQKSAVLAYTSHDQILIDGDSGFLESNLSTGISWGSGTASDPYIIEGWDVSQGIQISNTTVHFVVRDNNCSVIFLDHVQNGTLQNNTCQRSNYGIHLNASSGNELIGNHCSDVFGTGIFLDNSSGNNLSNNFCSADLLGMRLSNSDGNIISDNNFSHNYNGMIITASDGNVFFNNSCSWTNWGGFLLSGSNDTEIINNTCSENSYYGISLLDSDNITLFDNVCSYTGAGYGISLNNSSNGTVFNNTVSSNCFGGVLLESSSNDSLHDNTFSLNGPGVSIDALSSSNMIWSNTFYHNAGTGDEWDYLQSFMVQAYDSGVGNRWNTTSGYGNYWCEWLLPDGNHDGIVDNPYRLGGNANASDFFPLIRDSDGDGIPDSWEFSYELDSKNASDAILDSDLDDLCNLAEFLNGTDPNNPDTDNDGMPDGWEVDNSLNPCDSADYGGDADSDGLINIAELLIRADPLNPDTDADGMRDGWEVNHGLNPLDPLDATLDKDNDGMLNIDEYGQMANPNNPDSDDDGIPDGYEFYSYWWLDDNHQYLRPTDSTDALLDLDTDGLNNLAEYLNGTLCLNPDTDADGMPDGWEVNHGLNPLDPSDATLDKDNDCLSNLAEYQDNTNPENPDTDGDGLSDSSELIFSGTDPTNADTNGNGVSDGLEFVGEGGYVTVVQSLPEDWIGMSIFWSGYVISVKTNSSVLNAVFDKDNRTLTVKVSGPDGTRGACEIVVPKTMVDLPSSIAVFLDDQAIDFTLTQDGTYYTIDMNYSHSTHELMTDFAHSSDAPTTPAAPFPWGVAALAVFVVAAVIVIALVVIRRRRKMGQLEPQEEAPRGGGTP